MSGCPAMTFEGLSPARYEALLQTAQAQGLALAGEAGSTKYQGMEFAWRYEAASQRLTIQCVDKPFFVPCSLIEERIKAVVGEAGS